jgi:hypothetical protein
MLRKVLNHHDAGRAKIDAWLGNYEQQVAQKVAEASQLAANAEESQQQVAAVAAMPLTVATEDDVGEKVAVQVVGDAPAPGEQPLTTGADECMLTVCVVLVLAGVSAVADRYICCSVQATMCRCQNPPNHCVFDGLLPHHSRFQHAILVGLSDATC